MTIVHLSRPMERERLTLLEDDDRKRLTSNVRENLLTEMFTDCILVTKEGISVPVHKMVLTPSPLLKSLLLSSSCCRGLCSHVTTTTIMLPDISYPVLNILLDFFYTGVVKCSNSEKNWVREVLVDVLGVPRSTVMLHAKPGHTDCTECGEHVPVASLLDHFVKKHVEDPCLRDMARVEAGDSRAVTCTQHVGRMACDVDGEKTRISNGIYNYVGQEDPMSCVLDHYRIHFNNMLKFVGREHPTFTIPSHVNLMFDEVKLRDLAKNSSSHTLEPTNRQVSWNTRKDVEVFLNSNVVPLESVHAPASPPPSEYAPSSHSGGLSSPEDNPVDDNPHKVGDLIKKEFKLKSKLNKQSRIKSKSGLSSSSSGDSSESDFSDPPGGGCISMSNSEKYFQPSKRPSHNTGLNNSSGRSESNMDNIRPLASSTSKNMKSSNPSNIVSSVGGTSSIKRKLSEEDNSKIRNTNQILHNTPPNNLPPPSKKARQPSGEGRTRQCRVCRQVQNESQFGKHVTKHLYQLWGTGEVGRREGTQPCKEGCGKQLSNWKYHILHLATNHDELKTKLAARDESLSDYEMAEEEMEVSSFGEVGGLATLTACTEREVLARHQLAPDYFREETSAPVVVNGDVGNVANNQNPLLDSSQEDALVVVENDVDEEEIDVNDLLDDSQDDPDTHPSTSGLPTTPMAVPSTVVCSPIVIDTSQSDSEEAKKFELADSSCKLKNEDDSASDVTAPWDGEKEDRLKEVEEE